MGTYYLDTEFNEFGGALLSLALVRECDSKCLYLRYSPPHSLGSWVAENVWPIMDAVPKGVEIYHVEQDTGAKLIAEFLSGDPAPIVISDWPDDIRYFCQAIITGPGNMASINSLRFEMKRIDAYPTELDGAVQHNAAWDAFALMLADKGTVHD